MPEALLVWSWVRVSLTQPFFHEVYNIEALKRQEPHEKLRCHSYATLLPPPIPCVGPTSWNSTQFTPCGPIYAVDLARASYDRDITFVLAEAFSERRGCLAQNHRNFIPCVLQYRVPVV